MLAFRTTVSHEKLQGKTLFLFLNNYKKQIAFLNEKNKVIEMLFSMFNSV
jgi:hypothetical protein